MTEQTQLTTEAKMALTYYVILDEHGSVDKGFPRPDYAMHRALIGGGYLTPDGVLTDKGREAEQGNA